MYAAAIMTGTVVAEFAVFLYVVYKRDKGAEEQAQKRQNFEMKVEEEWRKEEEKYSFLMNSNNIETMLYQNNTKS